MEASIGIIMVEEEKKDKSQLSKVTYYNYPRQSDIISEDELSELSESDSTIQGATSAPVKNQVVELHTGKDVSKTASPTRPTIKNSKTGERFVNGKQRDVDVGVPFDSILNDIKIIYENEKADFPIAIGGAESIALPTKKGDLAVYTSEHGFFGELSKRAHIEWSSSSRHGAITKKEFFSALAPELPSYNVISPYPKHPRERGVFVEKELKLKQEKTGKLKEFLDLFSFTTNNDREAYKLFLMTLFWGGGYGQRPAFAIVSPDKQGAGKTTLVHKANKILNPDDHSSYLAVDLGKKNSKSPAHLLINDASMRKTMFLIDNVRAGVLGWADIEAMITEKEIQAHALNKGNRGIKNYLTWVFTFNDSSMSKDTATRTITISVSKRKNRPASWNEKTDDFIERHREDIVNDILLELRAEKRTDVDEYEKFRFGTWFENVAKRSDTIQRDFIEERTAKSQELNVEDEEVEAIEDKIATNISSKTYILMEENDKAVNIRMDDIPSAIFLIPNSIMSDWTGKALGMKSTDARRKLKTLNILTMLKNEDGTNYEHKTSAGRYRVIAPLELHQTIRDNTKLIGKGSLLTLFINERTDIQVNDYQAIKQDVKTTLNEINLRTKSFVKRNRKK